MNWTDYSELMLANGQKVYADKVGHHGVYEGVEKSSPTIYPHRQDTHEMRLKWVMTREVYPWIDGIKTYHLRQRFLPIKTMTPLFRTLLADVTRALVADGYGVTEEECPINGWILRVTWSVATEAVK